MVFPGRTVRLAARSGNDGQIYLSQLPFSVSEEVLRKDFEKFGEVSRFFFHRRCAACGGWVLGAEGEDVGMFRCENSDSKLFSK